jgi:hypothetical protein
MEGGIVNFWSYTIPKLPILQNNGHIVREFLAFLATNPDVNVDELPQHAEFKSFTEPTQVFLTAHQYLKRIDKRLTMYVNPNVVMLPQEVAEILIAEKRKEAARNGLDFPDPQFFKTKPAIVRFELILSTGDPNVMSIVDDIYSAAVRLTRKQFVLPPEWVIIKFRPPQHEQNGQNGQNEFTFKGESVGDQVEFILSMVDNTKPVTQNNRIELIVTVNDSIITSQEDIEDFRQALLLHIDTYIGECRSYIHLRSFTLLPRSHFDLIAPKLPKHYVLQPLTELERALEIIPKPNICKNCAITSDNTEMISIIEDTDVSYITHGHYYRFCFKLLSRIASME